MADQEIAIVIRAKDASKPGFDSAAKGVRGLRSEISAADTVMGTFGLSMGKIGGLLAGAFGVTAIVGAVKSFTNLTSQLTDLSAKTGIGTSALQKLKFMAEQSGGSLEQVSTAIARMGANLVAGDKSAVQAMQRLGLSIEDVRRMQPDQAFAAIADKIAAIESPMERSRLAMLLFGRSGADLLPMMTGHLADMGKKAEDMGLILSDDVVKAGDDFGDSLGHLFTAGMALLGNVLGPFIPALTQIAQWAAQAAGVLGTVLSASFEGLALVGQKVIGWLTSVIGKFLDFAKTVPGVSTAVAASSKALDGLKSATTFVKDAYTALKPSTDAAATSLNNVRFAVAPIASHTMEAAKAAKALASAAQDLAERGIKRETEERRKYTSALLDNIALMQVLVRIQSDELGQHMLALPVIKDVTAANADTTATLQRLIKIGALHIQVTTEQAGTVAHLTASTVTWRDQLGELAQAMTQLSQTAHNSFVSALSTITNGLHVGMRAVKSFKGGLDKLTSGGGLSSILGGLTGIVTGIGGIVSAAQAAIQVGKALFNIFDRDKGRDMVEAFAEEFAGGFDGPEGLHAQLLKLGAEGEQLWIKLTQGVGRNNKEQAAAAIDEVRQALARLRETAASVPTDIDVNVGLTYHRNVELDESPQSGFARGTPNLDFVNFGDMTRTNLHGEEAVVPRAGVGQFAAQVASALQGISIGSGGGTVIVQFGTREVARMLMPDIADEVRRLRLV